MALSYVQAVEQTITAAEQIDSIVNGYGTDEVVVEDGSKIPSVRKALLDNFYFKDPITWSNGQDEVVFNQLRMFTDLSYWYAPTATETNPVRMGATPIGDPLWVLYLAEASKLRYPRNISLGGDATGGVAFDGSEDVIITTNVAQSGKLKTARNVALSGDATGSVSFDGSKDVSIITNVNQATKLRTTRNIALSGDAVGTVGFNGTSNVTINTNVVQSEKLKTPRDITLSGGVSGTIKFDGSTDVNIPVVVTNNSHTHTISNVSGLQSALDGKLPIDANAVSSTKLQTSRNIALSGGATGSVNFDGTSNVVIPVTVANNSHTHTIANVSGLQSALDGKLPINSNAVSATKLQTARTVSLSGDATGFVSFDGTSNVTIPVVVADNSHNHTIANVSGLQSALDSKLPTSGNAVSATKLQTARTIGGVAFDGTANINLAGVNTTGNQNTTGNAASATKLQTTRTINGTDFNGTGNITTANWGTSRTLTVGNTGKSVNGASNMSWSIAEIGAVNKAGDTMTGTLDFRDSGEGVRVTPAGGGVSNNCGIFGGRGDGALQTIENLQIKSWQGVGFSPTAGGSVPLGDNTIWFNVRSGAMYTLGRMYVGGTNQVYSPLYKPSPADIGAPTTTGVGASGTWGVSVTGNAASATRLQNTRAINGTDFNGTGNIETRYWGATRAIGIGNTWKNVNGATNIGWTKAEIGANETAVLMGTLSNGGTIPLPAGYTESQCRWIASPRTVYNSGSNDINSFQCTMSGRVVTITTENKVTSGNTVNYIIIGVK